MWSKSSAAKLSTCDKRIIELMTAVCFLYDITVIEGHRSIDDQQKYYKDGKTKIDGVLKKGKHNCYPSKAVDIAPYPVNFKDINSFYFLGGIVKAEARRLNLNIRWGGDWDSDNDFRENLFNDLVHFEIVE